MGSWYCTASISPGKAIKWMLGNSHASITTLFFDQFLGEAGWRPTRIEASEQENGQRDIKGISLQGCHAVRTFSVLARMRGRGMVGAFTEIAGGTGH
jgi:hypothetical protein